MHAFLLVTYAAMAAAAMPAAKTPQMGWDTWNTFHLEFNESTIEAMADALVSTGLRDAGYDYVIIDDGWQELSRDDTGRQQANKTRFPKGIPALAKYIHDRGLKFGLYSDAGVYDCSFFPGSWGYEELDAATYADWEVDYLKYDNCGGFQAATESPQVRFSVMADALLNSGREIFYSLCQWGNQFPWYWADQIGQSYRMSGDITAVFSDLGTDCACKTAYCLNTGYAGCSVLTIIRKMREIAPFQHSGSFADMDMLEIGNGDMTIYEQQTHLAFWAALKSPLILGADITKLSNESLEVLKNERVIALSQDPLGKAALFVPELSVEHQKQIWAGPLSGGKTVVLALNELANSTSVTIPLSKIPGLSNKRVSSVHELWSDEKTSVSNNTLVVALQSHETKIFVI